MNDPWDVRGCVAVMGVDPGVNGGIAIIDASGAVALLAPTRNTMTEDEALAHVERAAGLLKARHSHVCFFEKVGYIAGDGGKGSFTFGGASKGFSLLLRSFGIKPLYVLPAVWQTRLDCLTGGDKRISRRKAKELFPQTPGITHNTADALLIAEYGRRVMAHL